MWSGHAASRPQGYPPARPSGFSTRHVSEADVVGKQRSRCAVSLGWRLPAPPCHLAIPTRKLNSDNPETRTRQVKIGRGGNLQAQEKTLLALTDVSAQSWASTALLGSYGDASASCSGYLTNYMYLHTGDGTAVASSGQGGDLQNPGYRNGSALLTWYLSDSGSIVQSPLERDFPSEASPGL